MKIYYKKNILENIEFELKIYEQQHNIKQFTRTI